MARSGYQRTSGARRAAPPIGRAATSLSLAALLSVGAVATGVLPGASADITQQIASSRAQLDQVNRQAERSAERYNAGRIALAQAQQHAAVTQAASVKLSSSVKDMQRRAGAFAVQAYRSGGGAAMGLSMLNSTAGPGDFLDRATFLDTIARRNNDIVDALATARHQQADAAADASAAAVQARDTLTALEADRRAVQGAAHQAELLLADLQAKQAVLVAAARDAATRRAALAQAAALAREAALNAAAAAAFASAGDNNSSGDRALRHYAGTPVQIALQVARDQLGKPYVWGAAGPDSFDCSGLTMYAYGKAGISLPHYTGDQWNAGRHVDRSALVPGDLVFFDQNLSHMGMYVGNNQFIHAPHSGTVVQISGMSGYWSDNYDGAVRLVG